MPLEMVELDEIMAMQTVAAFNAVEPKSDFAPDNVYIFGAQGMPRSLLVFVKAGCVINSVPIPNQALMMLMQGLVPGKQRGA